MAARERSGSAPKDLATERVAPFCPGQKSRTAGGSGLETALGASDQARDPGRNCLFLLGLALFWGFGLLGLAVFFGLLARRFAGVEMVDAHGGVRASGLALTLDIHATVNAGVIFCGAGIVFPGKYQGQTT
jgi:hypothetical protein